MELEAVPSMLDDCWHGYLTGRQATGEAGLKSGWRSNAKLRQDTASHPTSQQVVRKKMFRQTTSGLLVTHTKKKRKRKRKELLLFVTNP